MDVTNLVSEPYVEVVRNSRLRQVENLASVPFSSVFSDHMLSAEYYEEAWREVKIQPYGPLMLPPSISALQYGISVFEGLKAQRTPANHIALFRPQENARRLNRSAERLSMPAVPERMFLDALRRLVSLDRDWVPPVSRGSLYIRPCLFSVDTSIRVKPAERYLFVVFTFPFAAYYSAPVDVMVSERHVRAFPGGTGDVKAAGNYAPPLQADREANAAAFQTVLWLDGKERQYIEECGVMNVFFVIGDEVITPSLEGTILPGVTRDSVITLMRDRGLSVVERRLGIDEILSAHHRGQLRECFGTGTAATLSHVRRIGYRGSCIELPPVEERLVGPAIRAELVGMATGLSPDRHGWLEFI